MYILKINVYPYRGQNTTCCDPIYIKLYIFMYEIVNNECQGITEYLNQKRLSCKLSIKLCLMYDSHLCCILYIEYTLCMSSGGYNITIIITWHVIFRRIKHYIKDHTFTILINVSTH